jgi:hypothetical protein
MTQALRSIAKISGSSTILALITFAGNAQALTVFNFTTPSITKYTSNNLPSFTVNSVTASFSNPQGTLINQSALFNTNSSGICAWYAINNSTARCGALTDIVGSNNGELTGFNLTLSASQPQVLKSFTITNPQNVNNGSITFAQGSLSETFNFAGSGGTFNFSSFIAQSGTPILVSSFGTAVDASQSAAYRLTGLNVEPVPGPLPALGVFAAFGYARTLRKKCRQNDKVSN